MSDSVERFSNRVENYVKFRPDYPAEVLDFLSCELNLRKSSLVADIGSGTGISARIFLKNGNTVFAVEPNAAMRQAAEEFLAAFPNFVSVDGTAAATNLENASIDFVVAAQAFHWFNANSTRAEFRRILKKDGFVVLIWNERQLDTTEFLRDYEKFLLRYASDYTAVRHENVTAEKLAEFFRADFGTATFQNSQVLDFDGLKGRALSSSYMPSETDKNYAEMIAELRGLFTKHQKNGRIEIFYDTNIYYSQL